MTPALDRWGLFPMALKRSARGSYRYVNVGHAATGDGGERGTYTGVEKL
jgi:hypothetical protein